VSRRALLAALVLGVSLRAVRLVEHPFLHPDGPAYLALARDGAGGWRAALAGYYPPLYPAALRLAHAAGLGWEGAGRAVSFAAGVATIPATAALGAAMLGEEAGAPAALLAAVHPGLVRASAEVLAESLYGFGVALWALLLLAGRPGGVRLAAAGLLGALAALVRPEGIALVPLAALAAAWGAPRGTRLARAAVPMVAAALLVVPLVGAASRTTGSFAITGKEAPVVARKYGVTASGVAALVLGHPRAFLRVYPRELGRQALLTLGAVHGLLVAPLAVGLAAAPAGARRARALALATLGVATLGIPTVATGKRYVLPLLPLLLPWAAPGWRRLAARAPVRARGALAAAVLGGIALQGLWPPERATETCYRETCAFVAARFGAPRALITDDGRLAWLCGARLVLYPPQADAAALRALARAHGARVVVVHARRRPPVAPGLVARGERCEGRRRLVVLEITDDQATTIR